jgi:hypothetical protein
LGLISPFTFRTNTILQVLWDKTLDWDTPVPYKFITPSKSWLDEFFELPKLIKIFRNLGFGNDTEVELHVFVDVNT